MAHCCMDEAIQILSKRSIPERGQRKRRNEEGSEAQKQERNRTQDVRSTAVACSLKYFIPARLFMFLPW